MIALLVTLAHAGTWEQVEAVRDDAAMVGATITERAHLQAFLTRVVGYAGTGRVPSDFDERCDALKLVCQRGDRVVTLHGAVNSGLGLVAVRLGPHVPPLALVAPHGWFDLNTGRIVSDWFDEGHARVLIINTAHRYGGTEGERRRDADVAHRVDTAFQAMTIGATDGMSDALVVQVHGFSKRHGEFSAVTSDGETLQPDVMVERMSSAVVAVLGGEVRKGTDVPLLAATRNSQGRAVSGRSRFIHLELSRDSRVILREDEAAATALIERIVDVAESR